MKLKEFDVSHVIKNAKSLLAEEKNISPALKSVIEILLVIVSIFMEKFNKNSANSSKPPSEDKNRLRGSKKPPSGRKPGGQNGHEGYRLEKVDDPDEIEFIKIDKRTLPRGRNYRDVGYESRQVIDIRISKVVTEYRAQILADIDGNRYVAPFPEEVRQDVQYGAGVKSHAVYMSQFQLLPYQRIQDYFHEKMYIPLSSGSLFNFNQEAFNLLEQFDEIAKKQLIKSSVLHGDETGINIDKKKYWLHTASSDLWTYFYPHEKRGKIAMDAIGILPHFKGTLCHDHWKSYYAYSCTHALCNAHHLRELQYAFENDQQKWANEMSLLLLEIKKAVETAGQLSVQAKQDYRVRYRAIILAGEMKCPLPEKPKKGRLKKSTSRNLLERLRDHEDEVLRFMENPLVPFTNNQSENDIRMTKVQQKISGCFRSLDGALIFCRIRSYLSTCRKHNMNITEALDLLFQGKLPDFVNDSRS